MSFTTSKNLKKWTRSYIDLYKRKNCSIMSINTFTAEKNDNADYTVYVKIEVPDSHVDYTNGYLKFDKHGKLIDDGIISGWKDEKEVENIKRLTRDYTTPSKKKTIEIHMDKKINKPKKKNKNLNDSLPTVTGDGMWISASWGDW